MRASALGLAACGVIFSLAASAPARADEAKEEKKVETETVSIGSVKYTVPTTWKRQEPSNTMRVAQFGIPLAEGDKGKIELVVFHFGPGGGGSVEQNLERWKKQFKPLDGKEKVEKHKVGSLSITTLDAKGTYENKPIPAAPSGDLMENWRMLAAVVETDGEDGPFFFRMVGPKKTIDAQEEHFLRMLKEAKAD